LSRAADLLPNRDDIKIELANVCLAFYLTDPQKPRVLYDRLTKISQQLLAKNSEIVRWVALSGRSHANRRQDQGSD